MTKTRRDVSEVAVTGIAASIFDLSMISLIFIFKKKQSDNQVYFFRAFLLFLYLNHILRFHIEVKLVIHGLFPSFQKLTENLYMIYAIHTAIGLQRTQTD